MSNYLLKFSFVIKIIVRFQVGSYIVDVTVQGLTVPNSPLVAKAYDAGMIRVTDIQDGHVGVLSTFRVDASR